MEQPKEPKFKGALCQIFVRSQPYGGSDKSNNGHRYDSVPFANGMITAGMRFGRTMMQIRTLANEVFVGFHSASCSEGDIMGIRDAARNADSGNALGRKTQAVVSMSLSLRKCILPNKQ